MKCLCVFYKIILNLLAMRFTDGEGSSSDANQADVNVSLTKPSEQEDGSIGKRVEDASAASALKSKSDPEEDLLEGTPFVCVSGSLFFFLSFQVHSLSIILFPVSDEEDLSPPMARPTGVKLTAKQEERLRKADERAVKAQAEIEKRKQKWDQL